MSDTSTQGQGFGTGDSDGGQASDSLASGFLSQVPDSERPIVEKYVQDWDANVTRKFQEIHGQYEPYKQLGELEDLQTALEVYRMLDSDPEYIYDKLAEHLGKTQPQVGPNPLNQQQPGSQNFGGTLPQNQGNQQVQLPPQLQQQFEQQQAMLTKLAEIVVGQQKSSQQEQEDKALDNYMAELHSKYGDFDDRYVLVELYNGKDGDSAVKAFQETLTKYGAKSFNGPPPPPGLAGGNVPSNAQSVADLDSKDVKSLVANIMESVNQT
jgi:hypothetical protein